MTDNHTTYAIFLGADMDPERIQARADMAGGRLSGIGSVPMRELAGLELPLPQAEELWGVVMQLPGTLLDGPTVPVALRTGEQVVATVLTTPADMDDPEAVLAEADHWELPVAYRETLSTLPGIN
jgi:hypothetical protein